MKKTYIQPEVAKEEMTLEQMIAASGDVIDIDKEATGDPAAADSRLFDMLFEKGF